MPRPHVRQLRVEVATRAGGLADVAMAVDRGQPAVLHPDPCRVGRDVVEGELPGEQPRVGSEHRLWRRGDVEVPDRRHREGHLVVAQGVCPDDRTADAAVATFPDAAEPVDEEVVADVAPAAGLRVVGVDAAQQRRHLGRGVAVGVHRVVDEPRLDRAVARPGLVPQAFVGAPLGAGVDVGLRCDLHGAEGDRVLDRSPAGVRAGSLRGSESCRWRQLRGVDRWCLLRHRSGAGVDDRELQVREAWSRRWSRPSSAPGRHHR